MPPHKWMATFCDLWQETYQGPDLPDGPLKGTLNKLMSMHDKTYVHLTSHEHQQSWKTEVIAETPRWICLNKPSHLGTEYDHYHQDRPHINAIVENDLRRQAGWIKERNIRWLKPVNILDFETSGASLWAKEEEALQQLKDTFHSEKPNRIYHTLCHGTPVEPSFTVNLLLAPHRFQPWMMKSSNQGKKSITHFEMIEAFRKHTLLKATSLTERYHQVRTHLHCKQLPIVGDALYGGDLLMLSELKRSYRFKKNRPERPLFDRAAIHLAEIEVKDTFAEITKTLQADPPHDWKVAMKYLQQYGKHF